MAGAVISERSDQAVRFTWLILVMLRNYDTEVQAFRKINLGGVKNNFTHLCGVVTSFAPSSPKELDLAKKQIGTRKPKTKSNYRDLFVCDHLICKPDAQPCFFRSSARVGSLSLSPDLAPGMPTFDNPTRKGSWPVINDERPAVQLCSA